MSVLEPRKLGESFGACPVSEGPWKKRSATPTRRLSKAEIVKRNLQGIAPCPFHLVETVRSTSVLLQPLLREVVLVVKGTGRVIREFMHC